MFLSPFLNPLEDVAIAFPEMQIVIAHPSWPWQDEAISLAMHVKPLILKHNAMRLLGLA